MRIYNLTAIILALLSVSCGFRGLKEIRISPEFNAGEINAIVNAARAWCDVDPYLCRPVFIDHNNPNVVPTKKKKFCKNKDIDAKARLSPYRRPKIMICRTHPWTWGVAVHELGHALSGRDDHLEPGPSLMALKINKEWTSPVITPKDIDYVLGS